MTAAVSLRPYDFGPVDTAVAFVRRSARILAALPVPALTTSLMRGMSHEAAQGFRESAANLRELEEQMRVLIARLDRLEPGTMEQGDAAYFLQCIERMQPHVARDVLKDFQRLSKVQVAGLRSALLELQKTLESFLVTEAAYVAAVRRTVDRCFDPSAHERELSEEASAVLAKGIADAKAGRVSSLGSFAQYTDDA